MTRARRHRFTSKRPFLGRRAVGLAAESDRQRRFEGKMDFAVQILSFMFRLSYKIQVDNDPPAVT